MVVLDTSTLILLAKVDLLPVLAEKTRLVIPREVQQEALAKPTLYDARLIAEMIHTGTLNVVNNRPIQQQRRIQHDFGLQPGETQALLVARQKRCPIATDDGPTIKAAKLIGIPFITALHVLTELCTRRRIGRKSSLAKLDHLQQLGRYSVPILEEARATIMEAR